LVFVLPCAGFLSFFVLAFDDGGHLDSTLKIALLVVVVFHALAATPFLVYFIARRRFPSRSSIPPTLLYGWPMVPPALAIFVDVEGWHLRFTHAVIFFLMFVFGVLASILWRYLAYPADR